ncbi:MAG TPA: hypothetical protein PKJ26_01220 [Candidatus Woesebacteria bacterium]|nr:hypothetical protein [Candidatus Woesebacteria bacterium]HNS65095.1 hypothetical protein [Candidatus Woesebacteria bacterium]
MSKKSVAKTTNPLTTVTTLSKVLAAVLFIVLPFIGAYLGYLYFPILNNF